MGVRMKKELVLQKLRRMDRDFQFLPVVLRAEKPKEIKSCPWMYDLCEFKQICADDVDEDLDEPYTFGNFTTMVSHKDLLTQNDIEMELEAQEKLKRNKKCSEKEKHRRVMKKVMKTVNKTKKVPSELEARDIVAVAPSEGEIPRDPSADLMGVIMAFPGVYGGQSRSVPIKKVTLHKIIKFELRHKNGRVARNPELMFAMTRQSYLKQMTDLEQISLRKITNPEGKKYCAKDAKNSDDLHKHNEGYRFLRNLRGSPPYYEKVKKNVFAMMRYHGQPTFFTTFSAAEHQWTELLQQLGLLVDERHYTEKEIYEMSAKEKQRLILARSDICARHFSQRTNILFSDFLKSKDGPLGTLKEFFYRIEFQKRGSPHLHCLLWIEGAPIYKAGDNEEQVCKFIDNYISCSKHLKSSDFLNLELQQKLIGYQTHR